MSFYLILKDGENGTAYRVWPIKSSEIAKDNLIEECKALSNSQGWSWGETLDAISLGELTVRGVIAMEPVFNYEHTFVVEEE